MREHVKILVADDSPVFRKLIEHTLAEESHRLLFASTGHEAIELFKAHRPGVVLVDWVMPDLSGIEICQHVRSQAPSSYTYTIIVTGMSERENLIAGLAAGADDYLTKPFNDRELIARVRTGLRIVELQRQIEAKNRLLEQLALTDSLTGLPNRRAVDEWSSRQLSAAARHKFSFWVAIADLDHFKDTNDTYGHSAGDQVLKKFGQILRTTSRRSDICGRLGGEEFLMVITHATKENVLTVIERVRREFAATEFVFGNRAHKMSVSFGIAGFDGDECPDFNALVARADRALYAAKRLGRNRTEIATLEVAT